MKLEQSFEVQAPLARVWEALVDVERVAPCLPGAAVTGRNDDGSYNGEFKVKIGPTSAAYAGKLHMENVDEAKHTATMQASGTDKRGQGGAKATIVSSVKEASDGAATVEVVTDYHITGRLARFGRGGMIEEISNRLLKEFAGSLQEMLASDGGSAAEAGAAARDAGAASEAAAREAGSAAEAAASEAGSDGAVTADEGAATPDEGVAAAAGNGGAPGSSDGPATPITSPGAGSAAPESEPVQGLSLIASALFSQAKRNPVPVIGGILGFLLALRVFRRRGS